MEEFAIDLNPAAVVRLERLSGRERFAAYLELTKPRITFLIVLTAAAGFALASQARIDYPGLVRAMIGIALLSSGIATINQYMEGDLDALMRRTANRHCHPANYSRGKRWLLASGLRRWPRYTWPCW